MRVVMTANGCYWFGRMDGEADELMKEEDQWEC